MAKRINPNTGKWEDYEPDEQQPPTGEVLAVDIDDPEALRAYTRMELMKIIQANSGSLGAVPALRELMDRSEGKVKDKMEITTTGTVKHTIDITEADRVNLEYLRERIAKRKAQHIVIDHVAMVDQ